jgi:rhodanese-related sulfurtransferase
MSTKTDSKEEKAKELMKKCSDQFPECPIISTAEIISIMSGQNKDINGVNKSVLLVDVRSEAERRVSMIPFAISVEDFEIDLKKNPELYKTRLIVPYCTIGYRSGKYGSELIKNYGCSNVRNGEGVVLWTYSGSDLVQTNGKGVITPANKVHTFGSTWDLSSPKYTSVQFGYFSFVYEGLRSIFG